MVCGAGTNSFLLLTPGEMGYFDPEHWDPDWEGEHGKEPGRWVWSAGEYAGAGEANAEIISLWTWDGKDGGIKWVGRLKSTCPFHFDEVKALALTQHEMILVMEGNPYMIAATIERKTSTYVQ